MPTSAWKVLAAGVPWFHGAGSYPIAAYSEYVPPPRPAGKPYCPDEAGPRVGACGWAIDAYEEGQELRPGLEQIGIHFVQALVKLGTGQNGHGISQNKRIDNPYWPEELSAQAGNLAHERYVLLLPLALARTLDDKGRIRWTLFGGSEQGPGKAFWKGFFTGPGREVPAESAVDFFQRLLMTAYGPHAAKSADLKKAGLRILPDDEPLAAHWGEAPLPSWTKPLLWARGQSLAGVKYLLTFKPFATLPEPVKKAYLAGSLHLLPFPGSLLFWGVPASHKLSRDLPFAVQVPLLNLVARHEAWPGLRVPQSGWLHEPHPDHHPHDRYGPLRNTYKRSHRWEKLHRHQDELAVGAKEDRLAHVLFSTSPEDIGLYGKPMARNSQVWTEDFRVLLDGPRATPHELEFACQALRQGGLFGYRFLFPAMRVGVHEVYWQRPVVACLHAATDRPVVLHDVPRGYLTAYRAAKPDLAGPVELWPVLDDDPYRLASLAVLEDDIHEYHQRETVLNCRKLQDAFRLRGARLLPRSFARQLLTLPIKHTMDDWLAALPRRILNTEAEAVLEAGVHGFLEPAAPAPATPPPSLTYDQTATRAFEVNYWKSIARLSTGRFVNKDNADCVQDPTTRSMLSHHARDLEKLGDYLLRYYDRLIEAKGLKGKALAGEIPFKWRTDFDFSWMGGWLANQLGKAYERDLIVVIPGKDRKRAVIMGDHYDTAYMLDRYDPEYGGNGARLAAAGADDNHSATVALMLGAPIFLELSRQGKLACDIWLIHLTGEEFPSDCLGARALTERLIESRLAIHLPGGKKRDLSKTRVQGVYVLDMIAHNNDRERDIFQIAPGRSAASMWLAYQAHVANAVWNAHVPLWNRKPARRGKGRGQRVSDPNQVPDTAAHLALSGEVRPAFDPRSTLYNTDGQIFSDAGVPVVLFMENYDINRTGYHDTHDTMENIDLDYGAALAAITIESVARAATEKPDV